MLPFFTHAIEGEEFRDVEIQGFEGRRALGVAIALANGSGVAIRDCRAAEGTGTFLEQSGVTDQRLFVNNDLSRAPRVRPPRRTDSRRPVTSCRRVRRAGVGLPDRCGDVAGPLPARSGIASLACVRAIRPGVIEPFRFALRHPPT